MGDLLISLASAWVLDPLHHGYAVARDFIVLFNAVQGKAVIYFCGNWDEGDQQIVCPVLYTDTAAEALCEYEFPSGVSYPGCVTTP